MITRETLWVSNIHPENVHGHLIRNLNSKHIANIIHFMRTNDGTVHGYDDQARVEVIIAMQEEAKKRELTPAFLNGAPYPYDPAGPYEEYRD